MAHLPYALQIIRIVRPHLSKAEHTYFNNKLFAASALLVQSGALLVIYQLFWNCPILSQPKSAVHQHAAKLFQQHWRHLKRNDGLNSAFEKADRLLEQKRTGSHLY